MLVAPTAYALVAATGWCLLAKMARQQCGTQTLVT